MTIYYAGQPGRGYGWGVCNDNLMRELSKLCNVVCVAGTNRLHVDGPVFVPLRDHDFNPVHPVRGPFNAAYTFFEYELGPNAAANARKYDVVFCGSTWCLERMKERGITNGEVLVQGVDCDVFKPEPLESSYELRVFSGGKLELRKGQDIVVDAVKRLAAKYETRLFCHWFNPWPATAETMRETIICNPDEVSEMIHVSTRVHRPMPPEAMARLMNSTDIGIFPNRCEGGTNLVLMEYLACGKPAIVSRGTGHLDIIAPDNCIPVDGVEDCRHWIHVEPQAVADAVEKARDFRPNPEFIQQFTWARMAKQVYNRLKS